MCNMEKEKADSTKDVLSGKVIVWLGSSVTFGATEEGYSMVDVIAHKYQQLKCLKYAICGTTLTNDDSSSYVSRLKEIEVDGNVDMLMVQLSSNDATQGKELGTLTCQFDGNHYDDKTIIGAIETIIAYAKDKWGCPITFYTGTRFDNQLYQKMVTALAEIQNKWKISVINLWEDEEMNAVIKTEKYHEYMAMDGIHPTLEGYRAWWGPKFEEFLLTCFQ